MFSLLFVLLSFSSSLATKYLFLNDELCMVRPTLVDLNSVELKHYPFIISLNKCTGSCNVLSPKICVPKKAKNINVKGFNMITNKNEAKVMTEHISFDCKCKFSKTICNWNQKWNNKTCQCECKNCRTCKKYYSWNPSTCICDNSKYLKSTSVTKWDEIIIAIDILSTKKSIATNGTSTASINSHSIKVRDCYILHTLLLAIILLLIIITICYHYAKQKDVNALKT